MLLTGCSDDPDSAAVDRVDDSVASPTEFTTLDIDGDSYLDVDEIRKGADRTVFETWDADADSEIDRDEITGNAFLLQDSDGSGAIAATEWERGTERWYPRTTTVVPLQDADSDGDPELDADEFAERFDHTGLGEAWMADRLDQQTFKNADCQLYDGDDDGRVSAVEFETGLPLLGGFTET